MIYQAGKVGTSVKDTTVGDIKTANNYIHKLKSLDVITKLPNIEDLKKSSICFSDASFANLKNGSS